MAQYPWLPHSQIRGNLAIGNLRENLKLRLKTERGIHAETLLTAIGAIAGFACQVAMWREIGKRPEAVPRWSPPAVPTDPSLVCVTINSGETFFFGDRLNAYLTGNGAERPFCLSGFVGGALSGSGIAREAFPSASEMYARVSKSLGTSQFGYPHVESEHRPHLPAQECARKLWGFARTAMLMDPASIPPAMQEPPLKEEHLYIVASIVANQLMTAVKGVLAPLLAATLVLESAIAASKIDPRTVP